MQSLVQDLRYGVRSLLKSPGFTAVAVATLSLGIGVNTAIFGLADAILFRPLPVRQPEQLVVVHARLPEGVFTNFSYPDYADFREATDVLESLAAVIPAKVGLSDAGENAVLWGEIVSGNYFDVLGVRPVLGRGFLPEEGRTPGQAPVAVLSHGTWKRRFGADPSVVGRTLTLNGQAFTVVGVAPEGFRGTFSVWFAPELWLPATMYDQVVPGRRGSLQARGATGFKMVGRLRAGTSVAQAQARLSAVAGRLAEEYPATNRRLDAAVFSELAVRPEPDIAGGFRVAGIVSIVLVGLVLLVACGNVAHLLLARGVRRQREIALRAALGAARGRIVRQMVTESALLAGLGGAFGVGLASWLCGLLAAAPFPTSVPLLLDARLDGRVVAYAVLLCAVTCLAFGLVPALQASRPNLIPLLKGESSGGAKRRQARVGGVLVVGQAATSLVLVAMAGLFARSVRVAERVDLGFESKGVLLGTVDLGLVGYDEPQGRQFQREVLRRARALPGVASATLAMPVPMEFFADGGYVFADGREVQPGQDAGVLSFRGLAGPDYFRTMGTRIIEGRGFGPEDDPQARPVAVVNQTLARELWPGTSPIGRTLRLDTADGLAVEVVGVAQDGKYRAVFEPPAPFLYLALDQRYRPQTTIVVRSSGEPTALIGALRAAVSGLDPRLPLEDVKTLDSLVAGRALLPLRLGARLAAAFGALALGLAMIGLYGVVAFTVSQRTREIGIRIALGAGRQAVLGMVAGQGLRLVLIGLGIGLLGALALGRFVGSLLMGVSSADPVTLAVVPFLLAGVAAVACYLPAWRAARVDPTVALRYE